MEIIEEKMPKFEQKGETITDGENGESKNRFLKIIHRINEKTQQQFDHRKNIVTEFSNQLQQIKEMINNCEIDHQDKIQDFITKIEKNQPKDLIDEWNCILQECDDSQKMKYDLQSIIKKDQDSYIQFVDQIKQKLIKYKKDIEINLQPKICNDNQIKATRILAKGLFQESSRLKLQHHIYCKNKDKFIPQINRVKNIPLCLNETGFYDYKSSHLEIRNESIIWMDNNILSVENQKYLKLLKDEFRFYDIQTCTSADELNQILKLFTCSCLIISGSDGEKLQNEIKDNYEINSILVFCRNTQFHETWANQIPQVMGVSSYFQEIKKSLKTILEMNQQFHTVKFEKCKQLFGNQTQEFFSNNFAKNYQLESMNQKEIKQIILKTLNNFPDDVQNSSLRFIMDKTEDLSRHIFEHFQQGNSSLNLYTKTEEPQFYKFLNKILFSLNRKAIQSFSPFIRTLSFCLQEFNDNQRDVVLAEGFRLYRGVNQDPNGFMEKFKVGDTMVFPGFTSTSMNKEIAISFSNQKILYIIEFDVDSFGNYFELMRGKCIETESEHPSEDEFLFNCFSCFRIQEISIQTNPIEVTLVYFKPNDEVLHQLNLFERIRAYFGI